MLSKNLLKTRSTRAQDASSSKSKVAVRNSYAFLTMAAESLPKNCRLQSPRMRQARSRPRKISLRFRLSGFVAKRSRRSRVCRDSNSRPVGAVQTSAQRSKSKVARFGLFVRLRHGQAPLSKCEHSSSTCPRVASFFGRKAPKLRVSLRRLRRLRSHIRMSRSRCDRMVDACLILLQPTNQRSAHSTCSAKNSRRNSWSSKSAFPNSAGSSCADLRVNLRSHGRTRVRFVFTSMGDRSWIGSSCMPCARHIADFSTARAHRPWRCSLKSIHTKSM